MNQPEEALKVLAPLADKQPEVGFSVAKVYLQTGRTAEAVSVLTPLFQADGGLKPTFHLARANLLSGNTAVAVKGFEAVIAKAPDHPFAKEAKGWLQVASAGSTDEAAAPKQALQIGELLLQEELPIFAESYLKKAYDGLPPGPGKYTACHDLATIELEREDFGAVIDMITPLSAQLVKEKRGELLFDLAMAHCGKLEYAKAKTLAKQAEKAGFKEADPLDDALKYYIER
jgi:predicted Zn-dependent protease